MSPRACCRRGGEAEGAVGGTVIEKPAVAQVELAAANAGDKQIIETRPLQPHHMAIDDLDKAEAQRECLYQVAREMLAPAGPRQISPAEARKSCAEKRLRRNRRAGKHNKRKTHKIFTVAFANVTQAGEKTKAFLESVKVHAVATVETHQTHQQAKEWTEKTSKRGWKSTISPALASTSSTDGNYGGA